MAEISTDVLISCTDENRRGGIKRIFIINKDDISSFTASTADHSYTAVTTATTSDVWYEIEGELEAKSYTSEGSRENGSVSYDTSIEVFVPKMEKVKAKGLNEYVQSCGLVAIIETYNKATSDNIAFVVGWDSIMGKDAALDAIGNEVIEGALQGQNGYNLTLAGKQAEFVYEFVGSIETNTSGTVSFGS